MKIMLLEDNEILLDVMKQSLEKEGFIVDTFIDGKKALDSIYKAYDCFILDINVPNVDGIEILEYISVYNNESKVIIISSNHELETITNAYEMGCDEYLKKPFFMYELIHKVKRTCQFFYTGIDFNEDYHFNFKCRKLFCNEKEVDLTKKEMLFLEMFTQDIKKILSYEEIEDYVWEGESTSLVNIRALIKRLRKKIPKDSIKLVGGFGYSLNIERTKDNTL